MAISIAIQTDVKLQRNAADLFRIVALKVMRAMSWG